MGRPKKVQTGEVKSRSQAKRLAVQKGEPIPEFDAQATEKKLQRLKIERIYYPEDFPHNCPDPREDPDGFEQWAKKYYKLS